MTADTNAIVGSIEMCVLAMVLALTVGLLAGTWLAEFARAGVRDHLGIDGDYVDRSALERKLGPDVAALMLTNPNTCGLFENEIDTPIRRDEKTFKVSTCAARSP